MPVKTLGAVFAGIRHPASVFKLFLFFLGFHGFQVFGLEDLPAVQAFYVVDAFSSGQNQGMSVRTGGLHNST
jgi:hypothetical protein